MVLRRLRATSQLLVSCLVPWWRGNWNVAEASYPLARVWGFGDAPDVKNVKDQLNLGYGLLGKVLSAPSCSSAVFHHPLSCAGTCIGLCFLMNPWGLGMGWGCIVGTGDLSLDAQSSSLPGKTVEVERGRGRVSAARESLSCGCTHRCAVFFCMGLGMGLLLTTVHSTHHLYAQGSWCHHLVSLLYFWLELAFFFFFFAAFWNT